MKQYRILLVLLACALGLATVVAQGGQFPDADADGIPDEFDACPTEAGENFNFGCPDGVSPPDTDGDTVPDVADGCPDEAGDPAFGGCSDSDSDGIPDNFDGCPTEAGVPENFGCAAGVAPPDADGDSVPDVSDGCPEIAGDPILGGCLDSDGDGTSDDFDRCPDEAGLVQNEGCPPEPGTEADRDGDRIENEFDGCPDQPGDGRNSGCPDGILPPDSDGDTVPDIFDRCPNEAGRDGFDCPDSDGDGVTDIDDTCPAEAGDPTLNGCTLVTEIGLPAERVAIDSGNVASLASVGDLRLGANQVAASQTGALAVQTWNSGFFIYDLNAPALSPVPLESRGVMFALSADGRVMVDFVPDYETGNVSLQFWDVSSGTSGASFPLMQEQVVNQMALSPTGDLLALALGQVAFYGPAPTDSVNEVLLVDASGTVVGALPHDAGVGQVVFSPDGALLATGIDGRVIIWDVASQTQLAELPADPSFTGRVIAFSPDASLLAVGQFGGELSVWELATNTEHFTVRAAAEAEFDVAVLAVEFSPDGSMVAATSGPFVSGPPSPEFNNRVSFHAVADGSELATIENLDWLPNDLIFSPDGTLLIFRAAPSSVSFWAVAP